MVGDIFLTIVFMIPLYVFLIWAYSSPESVLLFGKRWKYQEDPKFSPNVIRYIKSTAIFAMTFSPLVLITLLFKPDIFGIPLMILIFGIVIIGAFGLLTADRKSK